MDRRYLPSFHEIQSVLRTYIGSSCIILRFTSKENLPEGVYSIQHHDPYAYICTLSRTHTANTTLGRSRQTYIAMSVPPQLIRVKRKATEEAPVSFLRMSQPAGLPHRNSTAELTTPSHRCSRDQATPKRRLCISTATARCYLCRSPILDPATRYP